MVYLVVYIFFGVAEECAIYSIHKEKTSSEAGEKA